MATIAANQLEELFTQLALEIPDPLYRPWELAQKLACEDSRDIDAVWELSDAAADAALLYGYLDYVRAGHNPAHEAASKNASSGNYIYTPYTAADLRQSVALLRDKTPAQIMNTLQDALRAYAVTSPSHGLVVKNELPQLCHALKAKLTDPKLLDLIPTLLNETTLPEPQVESVSSAKNSRGYDLQNPLNRPWELALLLAHQKGNSTPEAHCLARAARQAKMLYELLDFSRPDFDPAQEEAYLDTPQESLHTKAPREVLQEWESFADGQYHYHRYSPEKKAEIIGMLGGKKPSEIMAEFYAALEFYKSNDHSFTLKCGEPNLRFDVENRLYDDAVAFARKLDDKSFVTLLETHRAQRPALTIIAGQENTVNIPALTGLDPSAGDASITM